MGSLAEALAEVESSGGRKLLVDEIMDILDKADRATLDEALRSTLSADKVAAALKRSGHKCGSGAIRNWRGVNVAR